MNYVFLKVTTTIVLHQRFQLVTFGSKMQLSTTYLSKVGDNVFNTEGKLNK